MTLSRAGIFLLSTTVLCGVGGGTVGWLLGRYLPGYYRFVVGDAAERPDFDPVAVGVGSGVTQGLLAGLAVGCIVVVAVSYFDHLNRRRRTSYRED